MSDVLASDPGLDSGLIRKEASSLRGSKEGVTPLVNDPEHITVNGEEYHYKNFIGIGHLNVETGRGEVKAWPNDFIVDLGEDASGKIRKIVLPPEIFSAWFTYTPDAPVAFKDIKSGEPIPPAYNDYLNAQVLNNKSGPDKYMNPAEELGAENFPPDPSSLSTPASSTVREVPSEISKLQDKKRRGEVLSSIEQAKLSDWESKRAPERVGPKVEAPKPESIEEIRRKKERGEKLTGDEQARLFDADTKSKK